MRSPADAVIAGEFEPGVVAWAGGAAQGLAVQLGRFEARVPDRSLLPELGRYTHLAVAGELRPVGSVAASRGCSHRCRHCPVPIVYDGRVRLVSEDAALADMSEAVVALRSHGIEIRPSWLPFTPWTTLDDLVGLVDFVVAHDLIANVDPVQYSVRLLVPDGSLLLAEPAKSAHLGAYDPARLGWTWAHPDPVVDHLQAEIASLVEARVGEDPERAFDRVDALVRSYAHNAPERPARGAASVGPKGERARLTEPWFCCSEPTEAQFAPLAPFV